MKRPATIAVFDDAYGNLRPVQAGGGFPLAEEGDPVAGVGCRGAAGQERPDASLAGRTRPAWRQIVGPMREKRTFRAVIESGEGGGAFVSVPFTVEEDTEPRVVDVRPDLKEALGKYPKAEAFFQLLSYTHQREYVRPWRCSRTARRNGSLDPWTGETAE